MSLKQHQTEGLEWLQKNYLLNMMGRKGCLLADDMGLGKTLQVLAFIAWLIENGELTPEGNTNPEAAPWKPVLVVMPVMLLENETWLKDMMKSLIMRVLSSALGMYSMGKN
jgi:SNF2 family DNA or RNA helicase